MPCPEIQDCLESLLTLASFPGLLQFYLFICADNSIRKQKNSRSPCQHKLLLECESWGHVWKSLTVWNPLRYLTVAVGSSQLTDASFPPQIEAVVSTPSQRVSVTPHINQLLRTVLMQMRMNFTTPLANANDQQSQQEVCVCVCVGVGVCTCKCACVCMWVCLGMFVCGSVVLVWLSEFQFSYIQFLHSVE